MATRTPAQIQAFLDKNAHRFDSFVQYQGTEPNSCQKSFDAAAVRGLIFASWPYNAAAGNQSVPAVYATINQGEQLMCDRFYLPATPRDMAIFTRNGYPVFGIESKRQLADFDVVMTSISYPVLIMSFHAMLAMSDVPPRRATREKAPENYPFVMVGGQIYGDPECLAPMIDCMFLGECEDEPGNPGLRAVFDRIADFKADGRWATARRSCYAALAREFNFLYFPTFVDVEYGYEDRSHVDVGIDADWDGDPAKVILSKQVTGYHSNLAGMRLPFLKRFVKDMNSIPPLSAPPLLYTDIAMGAGDIEVGRGCPAWCSFCALTYRQKPYRQRSVEYMVDAAKELRDNMGTSRLAPFMPDFPMHTQRKRLVKALLENVSDEVDAPAMRVDDFIADEDYILLQVHGGLEDVTLGLEGNSQRMRDLVGKGASDQMVKDAVEKGIRAGIRKFKLFMISDLPGEDDGDILRIARLARDLADIREQSGQPNIRIQFSWTPLLIEANTPFQWFAPTPKNSKALMDVWEEFRDYKIDFKVGSKADPSKAMFFQLCQRASREVGEVILDWLDEVDKACWGGVPRTAQERLIHHLDQHGFHNGFFDCFDERFKHDMFGWEFIDQGVSVELLWQTYVQMREFAEDTDSATYDSNFGEGYLGAEFIARCDEQCLGRGCGVCDAADLKIRKGYLTAKKAEIEVDLSQVHSVDQSSVAFKVRAKIFKPLSHRFVMNDHWRFSIRRAAFKAQTALGTVYGIAKRTVSFASDEVQIKDWTSGTDYVEFGMTRRISQPELAEFIAAMNAALVSPAGVRWMSIVSFDTVPAGAPSLRHDIDATLYELALEDDPGVVAAAISNWYLTDYVKLVLRADTGFFNLGSEEVNAKDYVDAFWLVRSGSAVTLKMISRGRPTPYELSAALLGKRSWIEAAAAPAMRVESFVANRPGQVDFFRPDCVQCGQAVPVTLLDTPFHPDYCPACLDQVQGKTLEFA